MRGTNSHALELKNAPIEPSSLEEAKEMISLKNAMILKLKNYIASFSHRPSVSYEGLSSSAQQNLMEYFKHENDRLENKLLLIQTELGVEKTRSEQIKEVIFFGRENGKNKTMG